MKQSITVSQFDDAFINMNREDNFSYEGRHALYDWIVDLDDLQDMAVVIPFGDDQYIIADY